VEDGVRADEVVLVVLLADGQRAGRRERADRQRRRVDLRGDALPADEVHPALERERADLAHDGEPAVVDGERDARLRLGQGYDGGLRGGGHGEEGGGEEERATRERDLRHGAVGEGSRGGFSLLLVP